jgi:hypothetical protein
MHYDDTYAPSPEQLGVAWGLGWEYGHEWSISLSPEFVSGELPGRITLGEIEQLTLDRRDPAVPVPGIERPEVGEGAFGRPVLIHTTVTGRLRWEVDEYGATHFQIRRPCECGRPDCEWEDGFVVLEAYLGRRIGEERAIHVKQLGIAFDRHFTALARAIRAVQAWDSGLARHKAAMILEEKQKIIDYWKSKSSGSSES